jgi:hypothetical protein
MLFGKKETVALSGIKVIRSHRRTMSLEITKDGAVVVRAPFLLPERKIHNFVSDKMDWIKNKQQIIQKRFLEKKTPRFAAGENFLFLGKFYPLLVTRKKRPVLQLSDCFELSETKRNSAKLVFEQWYRKVALETVTRFVRQYAEQYSLAYKKIRVTGARTRWGSCNSHGHLSFSWRLIMAPEEVVVYVVVHELAHLVQHNHSKRFWNLVEKMCPDFKKQKKWLREHGHTLALD